MTTFLILLLTALATVGFSTHVSPVVLDNLERAYFLSIFNNYKRACGAKYSEFQWDEELEFEASKIVSTCSKEAIVSPSAYGIAMAWQEEVLSSPYEMLSALHGHRVACSENGNQSFVGCKYTKQMLYSDAKRIGCAMSICSLEEESLYTLVACTFDKRYENGFGGRVDRSCLKSTDNSIESVAPMMQNAEFQYNLSEMVQLHRFVHAYRKDNILTTDKSKQQALEAQNYMYNGMVGHIYPLGKQIVGCADLRNLLEMTSQNGNRVYVANQFLKIAYERRGYKEGKSIGYVSSTTCGASHNVHQFARGTANHFISNLDDIEGFMQRNCVYPSCQYERIAFGVWN